MNRTCHPMTLIAFWGLICAGAPAVAQPEPSKESPPRVARTADSPDDVLKLIPIKHAAAREVALVVSRAVGVSVTADERTNAVILRAPEPLAARVTDLVGELDQPGGRPAPHEFETRHFELRGPVRPDLLATLTTVVSPETRVATLKDLVVAQGPPAELDELAKLITHLNAASGPEGAAAQARPLQLTFYFIQCHADPRAGGAPMPAGLQSIADALAESGFSNASLLAPLVVNVAQDPDGREFELSGLAGKDGALDVQIRGRATAGDAPDAVDLSVKAVLTQLVARSAAGLGGEPTVHEARQRIFEIETNLTVRRGDYVVLAATPASTDDERAVALAVHVQAAP